MQYDLVQGVGHCGSSGGKGRPRGMGVERDGRTDRGVQCYFQAAAKKNAGGTCSTCFFVVALGRIRNVHLVKCTLVVCEFPFAEKAKSTHAE